MMRWVAYLFICLIAEILGRLLSPILPIFAVNRSGLIDNANAYAVEPRLPTWLSWFDTPDNSLLGDNNWKATHDGKYLSQVGWLLRNVVYGLKWTVLSCPVDTVNQIIVGNLHINRNTNTFGTLHITQGKYWQYKLVKPIGSTGYCWMLNFGWLLDDASQQKALFMISPRLVKIKYTP